MKPNKESLNYLRLSACLGVEGSSSSGQMSGVMVPGHMHYKSCDPAHITHLTKHLTSSMRPGNISPTIPASMLAVCELPNTKTHIPNQSDKQNLYLSNMFCTKHDIPEVSDSTESYASLVKLGRISSTLCQ